MPTYYVDRTGGLDTNAGTSSAAAWQTLAKVNGFAFAAGDHVLLKCGEVWRETLTPSVSGANGQPITFGAYGTGDAPVITGADVVTGFNVSTFTVDGVVAEQLDTSFTSFNINNATSQQYQAQEWIATETLDVTKVNTWMAAAGAPTGNVWIEVWNESVGTPGSPGAVIANGVSNTVDASTITTNVAGQQQPFVFATPPTLTNGLRYFFVMRTSFATSSVNFLRWYGINSNVDPWDRWRFTPWQEFATSAFYIQIIKNVVVSNVWQVDVVTAPNVVLFDGAVGTKRTATSELVAPFDWVWSSGTLYVYATSDPDVSVTSVEIGYRDYALTWTGLSDLNFTGIDFVAGNVYSIFIDGTTTRIVFDDCGIFKAYSEGLNHGSAFFATFITIRNCDIAFNGAAGVTATGNTADWVISNNDVYHNGYTQETSGENEWGSGIKLVGARNSQTCKRTIVEGNHIYGTGFKLDGTRVYASPNKGFAIWTDLVDSGNVLADGNIIRFNNVHDNADSGLFCEKSRYQTFHHNLSFRNGEHGIRVDAEASGPAVQDNFFYNNTLYGNAIAGISSVAGYLQDGLYSLNNTFINNISVGNVTRQLLAVNGGDNDGTLGSGNVYRNNAFGPEAAGFIDWGTQGTLLASYAAFDAAYGSAAGNITGDPLFANPAISDFTLRAGSPVINAGVDLGSAFSATLAATSTWPDAVIVVDQSTDGPLWNLGAFASGDSMAVNPTTVRSAITVALTQLATAESEFVAYALLGQTQATKVYSPLQDISDVRIILLRIADTVLPGSQNNSLS